MRATNASSARAGASVDTAATEARGVTDFREAYAPASGPRSAVQPVGQSANPPRKQHETRAGIDLVPIVRLFAEPVLVTRTEGLACTHDEVLTPLLCLDFDYDGTRVRSSDEADRMIRNEGDTVVALRRDEAAEARARHVLERLGAVEVAYVDEIALPVDCEADYVVRAFGDAHAFCDFTARALPQLRALGWKVDIDAAYPFHVTPVDTRWYAAVEPADNLPDWFSLELGVDVDGEHVDLLPLIMDLLEGAEESDGLRSLEAGLRPSYALKVSETHHVNVSQERLRALVQVVIELYQGVRTKKKGKIVFPGARAPLLAGLDAAFGGTPLIVRDPANVMSRARAIAKAPAPITEPPALKATLRDYQREGVAFLQHLRACGVGGILADDMGLGKTLQTIAHICVEKAEGRLTAPALIVGPTILVGHWQRELARCAPHLRVLVLHGAARHARFGVISRADVVITTYPLLVRDEEKFAELRFHLLVLDEAQAIKNTRSLAHRAIKTLQAEHNVCLTGTPVENHLGEMWALFDFLNPGLLGDDVAFRASYRQPIEQRGDENRLTALRDLTAPYILRRMKRDVARELPPKTEISRSVDLRGRQRELYEQIRVAAHADVRRAIRTKGLAASALPILDALMKLRQACCDPRLVAMESARDVEGSAKYEACLELIDQLLENKHRILLFSQFTSMLALLAEGLRKRGIPYEVLTGDTRDRQKVVDAFERGSADVFLISLKAGGTGLNLTSADTVIHYDPWWNPASQAQATDRAYRIGQSKPVFVYNLFVAGSVEERVMQLQQRKKWLADTLLGNDGSTPGTFGEQDVETLFSPLADAPDSES